MSHAQSAVKQIDSLKSRRTQLSRKIHSLYLQPSVSDLELAELKRERLMLKDRMLSIHQTTSA